MRIICLKAQTRCVKKRAKESAEINSANKAAFQKSRIAVRERNRMEISWKMASK